MSNKLTVVDIAPYLSHGIKLILEKSGRIIDLTGLDVRKNRIIFHTAHSDYDYDCWPYKPLLFPLSCIAEEITVRGETFVPAEKLELGTLGHVTSLGFYLKVNRQKTWRGIYTLAYWEVNGLHSWFIDTSDLIGRGLAIDVRTVNPKLYE